VDIKEYEAMSKIDLPESERALISEKAGMLKESFLSLASVGTNGVEALVTVLDIQNVLRPDISVKPFSRKELLENAPASHDGYFEAPKTLD